MLIAMDVENWKRKLRLDIIQEDYEEIDIFNVDEIRLFYKMISNQNLIGEICYGNYAKSEYVFLYVQT